MKEFFRRLHERWRLFKREQIFKAATRRGPVPEERLARNEWHRSLEAPDTFYLECFRYFHFQLPQQLVEHRNYFKANRRGFGDDAFHVMWFLLAREFHLSNFLEIGVYRGQTPSLISMLHKMDGKTGHVCGISPFSAAGDSVSHYGELDYYQDTLLNFRAFDLAEPDLVNAYSTDSKAVDVIKSRQWDCIYIDGNHDYEIVLADWAVCSSAVKPGGLIVLDDAGLYTNFGVRPYAFKGHPGPSRLASEIDRNHFKQIMQVGHNLVFQRLA